MAELTRERIAELRAQAKMYPYADMLINTEEALALLDMAEECLRYREERARLRKLQEAAE